MKKTQRIPQHFRVRIGDLRSRLSVVRVAAYDSMNNGVFIIVNRGNGSRCLSAKRVQDSKSQGGHLAELCRDSGTVS